MADDRPLEDSTEQLARITAELKDLRATVLARADSRPTGCIELALRVVAPAGTLLCQGQAVNRVDYPVLWQFAQDQSLVGSAFGPGNGTTTFTLPDYRGRMPVGVGTLGTDTYTLGGTGGSAFRTLTTSNMPSHDHGGGTNSSGSHSHGGTTNSNGDHGGHTSGTANVVPPGSGVTLPSFYNGFPGNHNHSFGTDTQGSHSHGVNSDGSGTGFDNRPAFFGVNWLIYT